MNVYTRKHSKHISVDYDFYLSSWFTNKTHITLKYNNLPFVYTSVDCVIKLSRLCRRDQRPETRGQRPETRDQRPEARDQRPETRDQRPEARDQIM
jgi:hypothetical protein